MSMSVECKVNDPEGVIRIDGKLTYTTFDKRIVTLKNNDGIVSVEYEDGTTGYPLLKPYVYPQKPKPVVEGKSQGCLGGWSEFVLRVILAFILFAHIHACNLMVASTPLGQSLYCSWWMRQKYFAYCYR